MSFIKYFEEILKNFENIILYKWCYESCVLIKYFKYCVLLIFEKKYVTDGFRMTQKTKKFNYCKTFTFGNFPLKSISE